MKRTVILLYPGFAPLDAIGPYHALAHIPDHEFMFVGLERGIVADGMNLRVEIDTAIDEIDRCDVLVVPGGMTSHVLARDGHEVIDWIRAIYPTTTWTTSVCTGSLMLGAAGILAGRRATTHWYFHDELKDYGAIAVDKRVVIDGNVMTGAGISAGIDMALTLNARLAGDEWAQMTQLDMEYAPEPPFNAGHPTTAPIEVTARVRAMFDSAFS